MPRVRTPTLIQMEAVECGAVALGIILAYYGRHVPLDELRVMCGVSRDGSKAGSIVRAAQFYGLEAHGYRKELEHLPALPIPFVVFWNFNHFFVVEGFGKNRVYVNDPRSGPGVVTAEAFNQSYTGIVLTFTPSDTFVPDGRRPGLLMALSNRLRGSWYGLLYVVLTSVMLIVPSVLLPGLSRVFIDDILTDGGTQWLSLVLVLMGLLTGLVGMLTWLQLSALLRLQLKLMTTMSARFTWHLLRLPIEFFWQRAPGELTYRADLNSQVVELFSGELASALFGIVLLVFYGMVMVRLDPWLTLIVSTGAILNLCTLTVISRHRQDIQQKLLVESSKLAAMTMGGLYTIETLKATGSEDSYFARWTGQHALVLIERQRLALLSLAFFTMPVLVTFLTSGSVLIAGGFRVLDGALSIGLLVAFQGWMGAFLDPINNLLNFGARLQQASGWLRRLEDTLNYPVENRPAPTDESLLKWNGQVSLEQVSFGYKRLEAPLIENFSLSIEAGTRVALVGRTGSGKTTIARLLAGLYTPWQGEIRFDDRVVHPRTLAGQLAIVDQDIMLFEGTARENITLWDANIPTERVEQAGRDACIHDDLTKRAGGYECRIEEDGRNLSGGQRQRLEIARALVTTPALLVLDEATSDLDAITEQQVMKNLLERGCTCLIVAHRLSTIRSCDEIVVLERGKIIERGSHNELLVAGGEYARLVQHEILQ